METSKFKAKFTGIVILTLILMTLVPTSANYAQNRDGKFKEVAERAKEKVDDLGALVEDASEPKKSWPDDFPEEIQTFYNTAYDNLTAGKYKDAMKAYREIYRMLNKYGETEGTAFEKGMGEEAQRSTVAIDRAYERMQRIRDVIGQIANPPQTYLKWVTDNLTAAETDLSDASALLGSDAQSASAELVEANRKISEAFASLKLIGEWTNYWRVESFLMGIKNSVERTKEKLLLAKEQEIDVEVLLRRIGLTNKDDDNDVDIDDFLLFADELISNARRSRKDNHIKKAAESLKEIREKLVDVHRALAEQRRGGKQ